MDFHCLFELLAACYHVSVHAGMLMPSLVLWHVNMHVEVQLDNAVHAHSAQNVYVYVCVCVLLVVFLRKNSFGTLPQRHNVHHIQSTWFNKSAVRVWVLWLSHSLPSCQPLPRWAKACKGTTERTDSPLEAWQQPTRSNPDKPQQLFSFCLQPFSSFLYFFCLRVGEIWQIFPSQRLLHISAVSYVTTDLAHLLFSEGFFSGGLVWEKTDKHSWKKQHSVLSSFPLRQLCLSSGKKRGEITCGKELLSFFHSHEVSVSN